MHRLGAELQIGNDSARPRATKSIRQAISYYDMLWFSIRKYVYYFKSTQKHYRSVATRNLQTLAEATKTVVPKASKDLNPDPASANVITISSRCIRYIFSFYAEKQQAYIMNRPISQFCNHTFFSFSYTVALCQQIKAQTAVKATKPLTTNPASIRCTVDCY